MAKDIQKKERQESSSIKPLVVSFCVASICLGLGGGLQAEEVDVTSKDGVVFGSSEDFINLYPNYKNYQHVVSGEKFAEKIKFASGNTPDIAILGAVLNLTGSDGGFIDGTNEATINVRGGGTLNV